MQHPQRSVGQKIAYAVAILCYALSAASALGAILYPADTLLDPIRASLMASVVFFASCGVVLHVIGNARLKGVLSGSGDLDD